MKINVNQDHGLIVWGKLSSKTESWAGLIISVKIMGFLFEEKPGKTWIWWLQHNTFSLVKDDLIYNFFLDFESHSKNLSGLRKNGVIEALEILSFRYCFDIPENVVNSNTLIPWASKNIEALTKNKMGKTKRNEPYIIPNHIIEKMVQINLKNVQSAINFNIEESLRMEKGNKRKKDYFSNAKKKSQYCIACRVVNVTIKNKHPLFQGFICDECNENAKQFLMPIAKDLANVRCCICFSLEPGDLILCDFCTRVFCNHCLSVFCGQQSINKIKREKDWNCFVCRRNSSTKLACGLRCHPIEKQIKNIYDFYPAENSASGVIKKKINQEIQVLALQDDQNIVTTILEKLKFPFKCVGSNYLDDVTFDPKSQHVKLLIQYYPNCEDYNEDKFDSYGTLEEFFSFLYLKNDLENVQDQNNKCVYWAFESSASITNNESNTISRFLGKQPILISMKTKNVRQRARFIWSNITILNENIEKFIKQDIFHHNTERDNDNKNDQSMPWCYSSVYSILNSLIQNNILCA